MLRVFIADNHPIVRIGLCTLFADRYEVAGMASDGGACLEMLASRTADIVMLDLDLAEQDGLNLLRILRSRGSAQRVMFFTKQISDRELSEALRLQIDGIVLKDAPEHVILTCIDAISQGRKWIDKSLIQRAFALTVDTEMTRRGLTPFDSLTVRERTVAHFMAQGMRNREIATQLNVSEATIKSYASKIFVKLNAKNRAEVARIVSATSTKDS